MNYTDPSGHKYYETVGDDIDIKLLIYLLKNGACGDSRYCELPDGSVVDWTHFNIELVKRLLKQLNNTDPSVTLTQTSMGYEFTVTYQVNYSEGVSISSLGAGIWADFQQRFEAWQTTLYAIDIANTGQSPEDVPSAYLAYLAVANNLGNDLATAQQAIMDIYGGGIGLSEKPAWMESLRSDSIYFQVSNGSGYNSVPYPDELNISPATNDGYWSVISQSDKGNSRSSTFWINEMLWFMINSYGPTSNPMIPF